MTTFFLILAILWLAYFVGAIGFAFYIAWKVRGLTVKINSYGAMAAVVSLVYIICYFAGIL